MFFHNYIYRLKCIIRDKQMVFWTFLFPILLATLFNLAFSNLSSVDKFNEIEIGIVNNDEYNKNEAFKEAITSVSISDSKDLFNINYTSMEEGEKLLNDGEIEGYIYLDDGIKLVVRESGLNQTVIKGFLDDFKQTSSTMVTIISKNPDAVENGLMNSISNRTDYLKEVAASSSALDYSVTYFYALIGMTCLFGGFWGLNEVIAIQANQSLHGARINMAPTHKLKVFLSSMVAATTVQLVEITLLLAYLILILKVSFGNQLGYIALTSIVGTITGVTFGTFIASVIKKGEGIKVAILIVCTNLMSFLSGMMYDKMKYIISANIPILGYLNPANLISDCFYSLYYYNNHTQFFKNISFLCGFIVFFSMMTYLVLRRQKYASI